MKIIKRNIVWIFIVGAIMGNVFVFLHGLRLGDQISKFEISIADLKEQNTDLEKKVYQAQSFTYASSMAAALNFTKKTKPIYIDNLVYAKN